MARTNKKGGNTAGLKGWTPFTRIDSNNRPDGRAGSSAYQQNSWWDRTKEFVKDKTINMSNLGPGPTLTREEKLQKADFDWNAPRGGRREAEAKIRQNRQLTDYEKKMLQRDEDKRTVAEYEASLGLDKNNKMAKK